MKNTGEQYIPGISSKRLLDEHVSRYEFAKLYCEGKDVLDIACGTGYGSSEIAKIAKSVVGVDISKESIEFANSNYKLSNLSYVLDDAIYFKKINKMEFDIVISFETIEHLDKIGRAAYLNNIKKVLKKGGVFIMSTPNKKITSPFSEKPLNKFHVLEFTKKTLESELSYFFKIEKFYGQRFIKSFFTGRITRLAIRIFEKILSHNFDIYITRYSPIVTEWINTSKQPRIIIVISKKQ